jgi:hypothetical protein
MKLPESQSGDIVSFGMPTKQVSKHFINQKQKGGQQ